MLGNYERHLTAERDLTPHTVRAYLGDVAGLLDHAARLGLRDVAELDLRSLRSWLAKQQTLGLSRTTLARRATAARVFTAWLQRTGLAHSDAGATLGAPRAHRTLPAVLRADEARDLIRSAAELADDGSPVGLRDVAMLELLYATGIRVGELVGLDLDDLDRERNVVRVLGKGRKERMVPFGHPAARALDRWLARRPAGAHGGGGGPCCVPRGPRPSHRPARGAHLGAPADRRRAGRARHRPPRAAPHGGHPPAGGRRRPAVGAGAARPRLPGDDAALHPRHHRPVARGLSPGAPRGPDARPTGLDHTGASRQSGSSRTGPAPTSRSGSR